VAKKPSRRKTAPTEPSRLGAYLKQLRTDRGLSLVEVTRELGFDDSYLYYLESGKRRQPHPDYLHRLARYYGVLVEDLYSLAGYTPAAELPDLPAYLRAKYDLSDERVREIADFMDFLAERDHG
jgi:transcriptional regulator with XRE-family HTH domain